MKNTDDIFNSIEGIRRAPAPDFFYTRLRTRMEKEMPASVGKQRMLRPSFIISGLVLLLLINAIVLLENRSTGSNAATSTRDTDKLQIVATAYHINDVLPDELNQ